MLIGCHPAKFAFSQEPGEAAFYGPKIDVQIWSAIGKEFTLATNQVDFAVPERFDLKFINSRGEEEVPLCIHRAPLSTHERMVGFLIEHYAGAFPVWLTPLQATVLPLGRDQVALRYVDAGFNRRQIADILVRRSRRQAMAGRVTARRLTAYDFEVPGQWQGRYQTLRVMGDSKAGMSTRRGPRVTRLIDIRRSSSGSDGNRIR